jgi:TP901 family phage tail tape measure protein
MSASGIKMGGVFVEIGADPRKFFTALNRINKAMGSMGRSMAGAGAKIGGMGVATLAPFAAAVRQGANYQSTLLNIQASTGATAAELDRLKAASMSMSAAMGKGPTEIAGSFLELLKAGMSVEQVLGGAGKAAIEFAAVGQMDVAQAAVVMSDAMNVFGVDASKAANSISSAADASSTSIELLSQSFSQVSAVAALANQSIDTTSAALAILANAGIKGSDAGTSLKTMLMRLMAPADDAVGALDQIGLSVSSFRDANGKMKPLVEIINVLNGALGNMDQAAKDDVFRRIFGQDAIRAAAVLTSSGTEGFNQMMGAMSGAMSVGEKYKTLMSGLAGAGMAVMAAMERFAIAVSDAVAPAIMSLVAPITGFINGLADMASKNKEAVAAIAKFGVAAVAIGGALTGLGISLQVASFGFAGIGKVAAFALSPLTMLIGTVTGVGKSFTLAMPATLKLANTIGTSMLSASASVLSFASTSGAAMLGFSASASRSAISFAAASTAGLSRLGVAALASAQATFPVFFVGFNRGIAAGAGFFSSMMRGFRGMAMASGAVRGTLAILSGSSIGKFAADISGALTTTYKSFVWWSAGTSARMVQYAKNLGMAAVATVTSSARMGAAWVASALPGVVAFVSGAVSSIGAYIASTFAAVAASVSSAAMSGAAWLASALPGVLAFVGGAISGIALYLGAAAMAVAGSVASAAAVAAAWLAPLAPFLLLAAAIGGAAALAYSFGSQIKSAFSGVGELIGQAGSAIGGGFNAAVSDGMVVFGDLATTATTTFNGIYDAISNGDLSGAMDILWLGLQAGWLRGVEALMGLVDPWISMFQNAFTILGAEIYKAWDTTWVTVGNAFNTFGAYLQGAFDNVINGVLAAWDTLESGVIKSWNYIQSFFTKGFDLKAENEKVDSEMAARARQRELDRPGVEGRAAKAAKENEQANKDLADRKKAIDDATQATIAEREAENGNRAAERRAATQAAEGNLASTTRGKREDRAKTGDFVQLLKDIEGASSMDQLQDLYGQFDALNKSGRLTSVQSDTLGTALDDAQERVTKASVGNDVAKRAQSGAESAGVGGPSKGEIAGTFSSMALGGMGFGGTLAEKQLAEQKETNRILKDKLGADEVAA